MKRIICCLDGTWNDDEDDSALTNVAKLHKAIAGRDPDGIVQISHYVRGIASEEGLKRQFLRGALGVDVGDRIQKGYSLLQSTYDAGDEIYIFGFSRGAFEARSLASLIALTGIAPSASAFSFDEAWRVYRDRGRNTSDLARVRSKCRYPVPIACVGVWDTVGNIGNPILDKSFIDRKVAFHDMRLPATVAVALHALSIDEIRGPFSPTLFTRGKHEQPPEGQHVEQVWFAGTHADVGGGWPETELSDIALLWMAERVEALTGLRFDHQKLKRGTCPNPLGLQHASATGAIFKRSAYVPFVRLIQQERRAISLMRRLMLGAWRSSWLGRRAVSINETIHDSVVARHGQRVREQHGDVMREITYAPRSLVAVRKKE